GLARGWLGVSPTTSRGCEQESASTAPVLNGAAPPFTLSRTHLVILPARPARPMCPDSDRPNRGLFNEERAACAGADVAQFVIEAGSGALVAANAAGWQAWGCEALSLTLDVSTPLALDAAMPALKRLRELVQSGVVRRDAETLTFWTARGLLVLR